MIIPDDGPWPGNDVPRDDLKYEISFQGQAYEGTQTVLNRPPQFGDRPTLTFGADDAGAPLASVNAYGWDAGRQDLLTYSVNWGDNVESSQTLIRNEPTSLSRSLTGETTEVYPVSAVLKDDDTGTTKYHFLKADVALNNDDDNGVPGTDLYQQGTSDPDLKQVVLGDLLGRRRDLSRGHYLFRYGSEIRVWDSPQKENWIRPTGYGEYQPPTALPFLSGDGIDYTGQTAVWIEGYEMGSTTILVDWISTTEGESPSCLGKCALTSGGWILTSTAITTKACCTPLGANGRNISKIIRSESERWFLKMRLNIHRC